MVLTVGTACGSETRQGSRPAASAPATSAPTTTVAPKLNYIAQAVGPAVAAFESPAAPQPFQSFPNPQKYGAPLVFLITDDAGPPQRQHGMDP